MSEAAALSRWLSAPHVTGCSFTGAEHLQHLDRCRCFVAESVGGVAGEGVTLYYDLREVFPVHIQFVLPVSVTMSRSGVPYLL